MSQYDLSRPVLDRLREVADIVVVVGDHVTLRRAGRSYSGLCPFHGETAPSFSVSREKGTYYCFGCKKGGDVIDFVMEMERVTFVEAVERLAGRFGFDLPAASPEARQRRREEDALADAMEAAQAVFVGRIGDDEARAFLEARDLTPDVALEFGLGFAPNEWRVLYDALRRRFPEKALLAAGLIVQNESGRVWDRFRDRITIPIRVPRGTLVAFGGRIVGDGQPKYLNSPETALFTKSRVLYALDRANRVFADTDRAIVCEGYFDCIALHRAGLKESVATLGTSLTEQHARDLARKVPRVVVCYDGDRAGQEAAVAALRHLLAARLEVGVVLLPEGQDPDDVLRREGAEALRGRMDRAVDVADFLISRMGATRDERRRALPAALEVVDSCPDPVRRFVLREALAQGAGVPVDQLGAVAAPRVTATAAPEAELPPPGELALLRHLLVDVALERREALLEEIPSTLIVHPTVREILDRLHANLADGRTLEISSLTSHIEDGEVRRLLAALEYEAPATTDERFTLILRGLWRRYRDRRLAELQQELARAKASQDTKRLKELTVEWTELSRRVRSQ